MDLSVFAVEGGVGTGAIGLPPNPPPGVASGWDYQGEYIKTLQPILDNIKDIIVETGAEITARTNNSIQYRGSDVDKIAIAIDLHSSFPYPQTLKVYKPGTRYYFEVPFGFQPYVPQTKGLLGSYKLSDVEGSGFKLGDPVWVYDETGVVLAGITTNVYISGTPSFKVLEEKQRLGTFATLVGFGLVASLAVGILWSPSVDIYFSKVYEVELVDGRLVVGTNEGAELSVKKMVQNKITERSVPPNVFDHWSRVKSIISKASGSMLEEFKAVLGVIERYKIGLSDAALNNLLKVEVTVKGMAQAVAVQIATIKGMIAQERIALSKEKGLRDLVFIKARNMGIV